MLKSEWPAWFNSPKGDEAAIFDKAEDVPTGWTSGAKKRTVKGSTSSHVPAPSPTHTPTKTKTKKGLRHIKVGVARPAPEPLDL